MTTGLWVDVLCDSLLSLGVRDNLGPEATLISTAFKGTQADYSGAMEEIKGLEAVVQWLGRERVCVIGTVFAAARIRALAPNPRLEVDVFEISEDAQDSFPQLVKKQIKPQGFSSFLILLSPEAALRVLQALSDAKLGSPAILLGQYTALGLLRQASLPPLAVTGPLFLVPEGCEWVTTEAQLILCQAFPPSEAGSRWSLINVVEGVGRHIGTVENGTVTSELPTTLTGTAVVGTSMAEIPISFNNGTLNPSGEAGTIEAADHLGVNLAFLLVQRTRELLPHHNVKVQNLTLGLYEFNYDWALQQLRSVSREALGVAMITGEYSGVVMGVYDLLLSVNVTLPQVGCNTATQLSTVERYPLYTRINVPNSYTAVLYARVIQHFGWKRVVVLYHPDDVWSKGIYDLLVQKSKDLGFTIANSEANRGISIFMTNYTSSLASFEEIVALKARIVISILYGEALLQSFAALYDLGLRSGDVMFLAMEWLSSSLFYQSDDVLNMKIKELTIGAIQFSFATNVGSVGQEVAREYTATYGSECAAGACWYYDTAYAAASGLDFLVQTGGDYENPAALNQAIRRSRFIGCSGFVYIESGTNDRAPTTFDIFNFRLYANDSYSIVLVGTFNPLGTLLFNLTENIIWPDNTTTVPSDTITSDIDCPFMSKQVVVFYPGAVLAYLSLLILALISVSVTIWMWRKKWNASAIELKQKAEISFEDYLLFASIVIEALQYASMGPSLSGSAFAVENLAHAAGVNLNPLLDLKHGLYWHALQGVFGVVGLWLLLWVIIAFKVDTKVKLLCPTLRGLGDKLLPIIGDLCWLPIISILLDVFQCANAADVGGPVGFQETFLHQDCYQHCWVSPHSFYTLGALLALLLYLPMAVYLRPVLQDLQLSLHVHIAPAYLMLKTIYQVTIIVLDKTVREMLGLLHAFVFLAVTVAFLIFTLWRAPYGYRRANLWHHVSLCCVLWYSVLSTTELLGADSSKELWLCLFAGGIGLMVIAGFVWQVWKVPALLYSRKGIHVVDLFRFMLLRGGQYLAMFSETREQPAERTARINEEFQQVKMPTLSSNFPLSEGRLMA